MYDKAGSVLRVETTINNPNDFKVYRRPEGKPKAKPSWQRLRQGVADMPRRFSISVASNNRYLDALASVSSSTLFGELVGEIATATTFRGKRARALNPSSPDDVRLLEAVSRGEFAINGFRNRDLRPLVASASTSPRQASGVVTRKIRLLRAHHLVRKVSRTHRYLLTDRGRELVTAVLAARSADVSRLVAVA
jgi:hypothetical protein